jgi:hypothetical protein
MGNEEVRALVAGLNVDSEKQGQVQLQSQPFWVCQLFQQSRLVHMANPTQGNKTFIWPLSN